VADGGYTLSDFQQERFEATVAASDQVRKVALAGLAIVWLFSSAFFQGTAQDGPGTLVFIAGGLLSLTLALDIAQLVTRAMTLNASYNKTEDKPEIKAALANDEDPQVDDVGKKVEQRTKPLFIGKIITLGLGYLCILIFFLTKIF
jgi:hypothetical protein